MFDFKCSYIARKSTYIILKFQGCFNKGTDGLETGVRFGSDGGACRFTLHFSTQTNLVFWEAVQSFHLETVNQQAYASLNFRNDTLMYCISLLKYDIILMTQVY